MDEELPIPVGAGDRGGDGSDSADARALQRGYRLLDRPLVDFRVTHHTALADKILANLELRFHQQNPVGAVRAEGAQWFGDDPDRDERQVGEDDIKRRTEQLGIGMADIGALDDLDPIVAPQAMVELAVADVERNDAVRSPLQETVGEPSGRSTYIDGAPSAYRDGELLDGVIELVPTPSDEPVGLPGQI